MQFHFYQHTEDGIFCIGVGKWIHSFYSSFGEIFWMFVHLDNLLKSCVLLPVETNLLGMTWAAITLFLLSITFQIQSPPINSQRFLLLLLQAMIVFSLKKLLLCLIWSNVYDFFNISLCRVFLNGNRTKVFLNDYNGCYINPTLR